MPAIQRAAEVEALFGSLHHYVQCSCAQHTHTHTHTQTHKHHMTEHRCRCKVWHASGVHVCGRASCTRVCVYSHVCARARARVSVSAHTGNEQRKCCKHAETETCVEKNSEKGPEHGGPRHPIAHAVCKHLRPRSGFSFYGLGFLMPCVRNHPLTTTQAVHDGRGTWAP